VTGRVIKQYLKYKVYSSKLPNSLQYVCTTLIVHTIKIKPQNPKFPLICLYLKALFTKKYKEEVSGKKSADFETGN